jgi:predicted lipoprotein with Yx(FWY)xxD motif
VQEIGAVCTPPRHQQIPPQGSNHVSNRSPPPPRRSLGCRPRGAYPSSSPPAGLAAPRPTALAVTAQHRPHLAPWARPLRSTCATPAWARLSSTPREEPLYLFEAEKGGKSACDAACGTVWPPYLSNGAPQAGTGASGGLIGTTARADGSTQVTYGGHPLYYYVDDKAPGDATGQDIDQFGTKWYVVDKAGKKVDKD